MIACVLAGATVAQVFVFPAPGDAAASRNIFRAANYFNLDLSPDLRRLRHRFPRRPGLRQCGVEYDRAHYSGRAEKARRFSIEPRVAMLSFSNFGSTPHLLADKVPRRRTGARARSGADDRWRNAGRYRGSAAHHRGDYPFSTLKVRPARG
jgi:hypothetical protein